MKSAAQGTKRFDHLLWSVTAWELTWSQAVEIGYPRVYLTVSSDGAARVAKRVLFCLLESADTFPSDILVSLSLDISRPNQDEAKVGWGRLRAEGGGLGVD